ncbi:MAG: ribulose-phosphate 3-epimerase [Bacilli bacterium]|nr:ribulose-phosphate 3-epimerase [Bacilli bacterium]
MKIAGSFLKIANDKEKINKLNNAVDQIHFDIMDGKFTERATISLNTLEENLKDINKKIDIHLMVINIKKYIDEVLKFNPTYITFHIEATDNPEYFIKYIKEKNIKVGIAINPETNIKKILPYIKEIDLVLIMSVHPGKGGQKFIDISEKINTLYEYKNNNKLSYVIEVDGGINNETIKKIKKADIAVAGSFITDSGNYQKQVKLLRGDYNE